MKLGLRRSDVGLNVTPHKSPGRIEGNYEVAVRIADNPAPSPDYMPAASPLHQCVRFFCNESGINRKKISLSFLL
jgi:hypothetical protein